MTHPSKPPVLKIIATVIGWLLIVLGLLLFLSNGFDLSDFGKFAASLVPALILVTIGVVLIQKKKPTPELTAESPENGPRSKRPKPVVLVLIAAILVLSILILYGLKVLIEPYQYILF